jgi:hypothetical protein
MSQQAGEIEASQHIQSLSQDKQSDSSPMDKRSAELSLYSEKSMEVVSSSLTDSYFHVQESIEKVEVLKDTAKSGEVKAKLTNLVELLQSEKPVNSTQAKHIVNRVFAQPSIPETSTAKLNPVQVSLGRAPYVRNPFAPKIPKADELYETLDQSDDPNRSSNPSFVESVLDKIKSFFYT